MALVELQGMDTLVGVLNTVAVSGKPVVMTAIGSVMMQVFSESQHQVPVRTGALKASGHIEFDTDEVSIGYGGTAAEYAVWVHENLQAHHRPPTKAKYLEDPMKDAGPRFDAIAGSGRLEAAILRQYPQSPAIGHAQEMAVETAAGYRGQSEARRRAAVAHGHAFTHDEIRNALARASAAPGHMIRKRP